MASASSVRILGLAKCEEIDQVARGSARALFDRRTLTVQGWIVAHSSPAAEVELIDTKQGPVTCAPVNMPRPDISQAIGNASTAARAGFRIALEARGSGASALEIHAVFADGSRALLARMRLEVSASSEQLRGFRRWLHQGRGADQVSWSVLSISGETEKVLEGKDGWLFLRGDSNDVIGQHTGRVKLGEDDRHAWDRVLTERLRLVEELEVVWLCVVIPDKESLYPEYLPVNIKPSETRPVYDVLRLAERLNAPMIYSLSDLQRAKSSGHLYPKTDTHWNHHGAYVVYRRICAELIGRGIPVSVCDEGEISWLDEQFAGDLGIKVYPGPVESPMTRASLGQHRGKLVFDNGIRNHGRVLIFEREDLEGGPTCVVFGESFIENLLIFLKETFARLVVVHTSMFIEEVVEGEGADVVLSFPLERFMVRVPDDRDALLKLDAAAREKGGRVPWVATQGQAGNPISGGQPSGDSA